MNDMGDELYKKRKMLAKVQAKIGSLEDELGKAKKKESGHL